MIEGRRYDFEAALAEIVVDYLASVLDDSVTKNEAGDAVVCPVVSFLDPMSVDEADRIIVFVPSGETLAENPASFAAMVEVGIKTQWKQNTEVADFQKHRDRDRAVRDKLFFSGLADAMDAFGDGIGINFIQPRRSFTMSVKQGWLYSEATLTINAFFRNNNP